MWLFKEICVLGTENCNDFLLLFSVTVLTHGKVPAILAIVTCELLVANVTFLKRIQKSQHCFRFFVARFHDRSLMIN